jgi:hypothetical protein
VAAERGREGRRKGNIDSSFRGHVLQLVHPCLHDVERQVLLGQGLPRLVDVDEAARQHPLHRVERPGLQRQALKVEADAVPVLPEGGDRERVPAADEERRPAALERLLRSHEVEPSGL